MRLKRNSGKKRIKILHLASFHGNIGDFANHQGFYTQFFKKMSADITQLEIRKFYKNRSEMKFDNSFVGLANSFDLLIIGGGGFFDLKWDYSNTGTTIDISEKMIRAIKVPVIINALGYHEYGSVDEDDVNKFRRFLDIISSNNRWLVSVRNDGSFNRIQKRYGDYSKKILRVPDNGFLYLPKNFNRSLLCDKSVWIGMNITNELFNSSFNKKMTVEAFNVAMSIFIAKLLKENSTYKIIFFAHTDQDISTISKVLCLIDEEYRRERIAVAPFYTDEKSVGQVFDLYRICSCVIAMRFHANVCCIGMNIPTIGLAGHEQILELYNEIRLADRCIKIDSINFSKVLLDKLSYTMYNITKIKKKYLVINRMLHKQSDKYIDKISDFINHNIT